MVDFKYKLNGKYSIEDLQKHAQDLDGECLSKKFKTSYTKYNWRCNKCGKEWDAPWYLVKLGFSWCFNHPVNIISYSRNESDKK